MDKFLKCLKQLYSSVISLIFTFLQAVTWLLQVHEFAKKICNPLTEFP